MSSDDDLILFDDAMIQYLVENMDDMIAADTVAIQQIPQVDAPPPPVDDDFGFDPEPIKEWVYRIHHEKFTKGVKMLEGVNKQRDRKLTRAMFLMISEVARKYADEIKI